MTVADQLAEVLAAAWLTVLEAPRLVTGVRHVRDHLFRGKLPPTAPQY